MPPRGPAPGAPGPGCPGRSASALRGDLHLRLHRDARRGSRWRTRSVCGVPRPALPSLYPPAARTGTPAEASTSASTSPSSSCLLLSPLRRHWLPRPQRPLAPPPPFPSASEVELSSTTRPLCHRGAARRAAGPFPPPSAPSTSRANPLPPTPRPGLCTCWGLRRSRPTSTAPPRARPRYATCPTPDAAAPATAPSAARPGAPRPTCSTPACGRCRSGVAGELYIGGAGLGPRLPRPPRPHRRALPPRPLRPAPGARLYRTGDLARWRADGTLEFLGRPTTRSRSAASASSSARSRPPSAATRRSREARRRGSREDAAGRRGWSPTSCRPRGGSAPRRRASCARFLATQPARAHGARRVRRRWPRCPLTANGKVDRGPSPRRTLGARSAAACAAPRTPIEEVAGRHLGRGPRRASGSASHDDFFDLGGHSLLGHPGRLPGARRVRRRAAAARPVRGADRRRPGAAGRARPAGGAATAAPPLDARRRATDGAPALLRPAAPLVPRPARAAAAPPTTSRPPCGCAGRSTSPALARRLARDRPRATRPCAPPSPRRAGGPVQVVAPAAGSRSPCVDLSGLPPAGAEAEARAPRRRPRRGGRSTSRAARSCGRSLLRLGEEEHACCSPSCTTSSRTAGRSAILLREMAALYRPPPPGEPLAAAAAARPVRRLRRSGSAVARRARCWTRQLAYWRGAARRGAARASSCRPTGRGRRSDLPRRRRRRFALPRGAPRRAAGARPARRARPCSWSCWPASQALLDRGSPGRTTLAVGSPVANRTRASWSR